MQRIWAANEIKPHPTRKFKLSRDPNFEAKFWDVIGLYLNPPAKALMLCCDEKSQALERTQLGLPLDLGHSRLIVRIGCVAGIIVSTLIKLMKFGSLGICPRMQLRRSTEMFVHDKTDFFSSLLGGK